MEGTKTVKYIIIIKISSSLKVIATMVLTLEVFDLYSAA